MSSNLFSKIALLPKLIKDGKAKYLWNAFSNRLYSKEIAFGFKRDLSIPFKKPRTLKPISIREFTEADKPFFIDNPNNGFILKFNTCYIGETKEQVPCARVWLIDSSENNKLRATWGNRFPQLKQDEVLLENVFTVPKYRGMGIIPAFLYDVAEKSKDLGAKYAITFGEVKNINTTRSYSYAGFSPYIVRNVSYFLFIKSIKYEVVSKEYLDFYNKSINRKAVTK
ncbi:hypothetical protein [Bizionia arctica]|nr:hypothetical protein [Bizionia arctica]